MTDDPCEQLLKDFRAATIEWSQAAGVAQAFVVVEPISDTTDLVPKSEQYFEQMRQAFDKVDAAQKKYMQAYHAYSECQQRNKK